MPMIHFLPLLPEISPPYTAPPTTSGTSSASSSRSSSISYTSGPSVNSLLTQIRNLTYSLKNGGCSPDGNEASNIEDIDSLNREVDYLSYFISAPLSLTPALPGRSSQVELEQFNDAIRDLNAALSWFSGGADGSNGERRGSSGRVSTHRHKLSPSSRYYGGEEDTRLKMLRRFE